MKRLIELPRLRPASVATLPAAALCALLGAGCGKNLAPQITSLTANPTCSPLSPSGPGGYVDVTLSARATGGNPKSQPTGVNAPLDMTWDFGDGGTDQNKSLVFHRYTASGTYHVTVTVKDKDGDADERGVDVRVLTAEEAIIAQATKDEVVTVSSGGSVIGYDAHFSATASSACNLSPLETQFLYEWNFGDNTPLQRGEQVVHRYAATGGPYNVTISVTMLNSDSTKQVDLPGVAIP
jgi:PKD repeat protein